MPNKKKITRTIVEEPLKASTPEELEAARQQSKVNAGGSPVVTPPNADTTMPFDGVVMTEAPVMEAKPEPKKATKTTDVIFKSIDERNLQLGIGKNFFEGTTITVPSELADEAERILTEGHYLITRIN